VYVYMYMCICVYVYMCICVYVYTRVDPCIKCTKSVGDV